MTQIAAVRMRCPGRFRAPGDFLGRPRGTIDGHHEVEVIVRGHGAFRREGRWLRVGAGDVLWWRPGEIVHARVDPEDAAEPYACIVFGFAPEVEPPPTAFRSAWRPSGEAIAFAEEVLRAEAAGRGDRVLLAAWAYHSLLWRCQADAGAGPEVVADDDPVALAERWMEARLHEDLAVADLARAAGCSPGHLHELFRARRGVTPMAALWELRLQRLRGELVAGDAPLGELAPRFGFADAAHLCRRFKARFGTTTGALRRAYRRREA